MEPVRPKKHLGQHFLKDENIARKIVDSLSFTDQILEIGAGTGVLTKYLITKPGVLKVIEVDSESIDYLSKHFAFSDDNLIFGDFLKSDVSELFQSDFSVIGNLPYNISSQIFFKVIENRVLIPEVVCMVQKEVAERLAAKPGNKTYGILSVLLGVYYKIDLLFTVSEHVFVPPPKVKSAVIRLTRKSESYPEFNERLFFEVVKTAFNQRRKTMRNSLKKYWFDKFDPDQYPVFKQRPEELGILEFIDLVNLVKERV